jgi:hypothetical protein
MHKYPRITHAQKSAPAATVPGVGKSLQAQVQELAARLGVPDVQLRLSARRRTTVSAFRESGVVVISAPVRIRGDELLPLAEQLLNRLISQAQGKYPSDELLAKRAGELAKRWLPPGHPAPASVRWSSSQARVWGTCVADDGAIRIATRLRGMPDYVLDYVLLHELAHLVHTGHGPQFDDLLAAFPDRDRARGFLDGVTWSSQNGEGDYLSAQQMDLFPE